MKHLHTTPDSRKNARPSSPSSIPPTSVKEMRVRGWEQADIILFTGDAFVDHPAFGAAVIARVLEHEGLKVAVVPQPNWRDDLRDFKKLGAPRLFFGVTSGNMDSMVNHYTANKRLRSNDAYTPGNAAGQRPDYAVTVYANILRDLFPTNPIILGGIEASLRRFTHYDYWSDSLKPSILIDSRADLVVYGLGEQAIVEVARALNAGQRVEEVQNIPQTVYRTNDQAALRIPNAIVLSSFDDCQRDKHAFGQSFIKIEQESNSMYQKHLIEPFRDSWIVVNPSYPPQSTTIVDAVYDLPFTRRPHPRYDGKGPITAFEMIKDSVNIHRGCFGGCSFCTISAHQGKFISSRSKESVLKELRTIAASPDFKGHITDVGGPSANMYQMEGIDLAVCAVCKRASCIYPTVCENLNVDHTPMVELYREAREIEGITKVTIGSGLRYDMLIDKNNKPRHKSALTYIRELVTHHVSGRLKVAPEHVSDKILKLIRKPSFDYFLHFRERFNAVNKELGRKQQLIPYFISSLPASDLSDMAEVSVQLRDLDMRLEQVQDFTPTPLTLGSVVYYTGVDPYSRKELYIARTPAQKKLQQLFFFLYRADKRAELKKELGKLKRFDVLRRLGL